MTRSHWSVTCQSKTSCTLFSVLQIVVPEILKTHKWEKYLQCMTRSILTISLATVVYFESIIHPLSCCHNHSPAHQMCSQKLSLTNTPFPPILVNFAKNCHNQLNQFRLHYLATETLAKSESEQKQTHPMWTETDALNPHVLSSPTRWKKYISVKFILDCFVVNVICCINYPKFSKGILFWWTVWFYNGQDENWDRDKGKLAGQWKDTWKPSTCYKNQSLHSQ